MIPVLEFDGLTTKPEMLIFNILLLLLVLVIPISYEGSSTMSGAHNSPIWTCQSLFCFVCMFVFSMFSF